MNSVEIDKVLKRVCGDQFIGVFAKDRVPIIISKRPALLIVNTDVARQPGTHWIAIYFDTDNSGEYFESLGRLPILADYINRHCQRWVYSMRQIQSVANRFCGHYCIFYGAYRPVDII